MSKMYIGKSFSSLEANLVMMILEGIRREECIRHYRRGSNQLSNLQYPLNPKTPNFSPRQFAQAQLWLKEARQTRIAR